MASMDAGAVPTVPWPRTRAELRAEWRRVGELAAAVPVEPGTDVGRLSREQRCLLGIWSAARWTVGELAVTPITGRVVRPGVETALAELDAAERVLDARDIGWEFASGVERWLDWLIGAQDAVLYPAA
jgi:hypothetical protein